MTTFVCLVWDSKSIYTDTSVLSRKISTGIPISLHCIIILVYKKGKQPFPTFCDFELLNTVINSASYQSV